MTEQSKIHFKQGSSELPNVNEEGSIYFQTPDNNKRNKIYVDSDNTRHLMGGDPSGCVEYLEDTGAIDLGTIANRPTKGITLNPYDDPETSLYPWTDSTLVRRTNQVTGSINGDTVEEAFAQLNKSIKIGATQKNINEGSSNISWSESEIGYRYEWIPAIKRGAWSRILSVGSNYHEGSVGSAFILSFIHNRSGVIYNNTFLITGGWHHTTSLVKLGGSYYDDIKLTLKISTWYRGGVIVDVLDNNNLSNNSGVNSDGTISNIHCSLIPIDIDSSTLKLYKKDVDGFIPGSTDPLYSYTENTASADQKNRCKVTKIETYDSNVHFEGDISGTLRTRNIYSAPIQNEDGTITETEQLYNILPIICDSRHLGADGWTDNDATALRATVAAFKYDTSRTYRNRLQLGNQHATNNKGGGSLELYGLNNNFCAIAYEDNSTITTDYYQKLLPGTGYLPHTPEKSLGNNLTPVYIQNGIFKTCSSFTALPEVTSANNGEFLRVVNGAWASQTVEAAETLTYSAGVSASE